MQLGDGESRRRRAASPAFSYSDRPPRALERLQRVVTQDDDTSARRPLQLSPRDLRALGADIDEDCQAWLAGGISSGDPSVGTIELTDADLAALKVPAEDRLEIMLLHDDITESYEAAKGSYKEASLAPRADRITSAEEWPILTNTDMDSFVDWYARIRRHLMSRFGIFLTPLTSVQLNCKQYGLALPGLGLKRWQKQSKVLFLILDQVLPDSDSRNTKFSDISRRGGSGFELLWQFGFEDVGIWDPEQELTTPTWPADNSVRTWFSKCHLFTSLSHQRGDTMKSELTECKMFLRGLKQHPKYSSIAAAELLRIPFESLVEEPGVPPHQWRLPPRSRPDFLAKEIIKGSRRRSIVFSLNQAETNPSLTTNWVSS